VFCVFVGFIIYVSFIYYFVIYLLFPFIINFICLFVWFGSVRFGCLFVCVRVVCSPVEALLRVVPVLFLCDVIAAPPHTSISNVCLHVLSAIVRLFLMWVLFFVYAAVLRLPCLYLLTASDLPASSKCIPYYNRR